MSMTDSIADALTRVRNGQVARHQAVPIPFSELSPKGNVPLESHQLG